MRRIHFSVGVLLPHSRGSVSMERPQSAASLTQPRRSAAAGYIDAAAAFDPASIRLRPSSANPSLRHLRRPASAASLTSSMSSSRLMAGTRHTQSLVESRTFEKSTVSLWRHEPLQGPRASPALAVAQRTFARSRLAARGLDPNALLPDSDEADEKRSSMVDRAVEALIPHHSLRPPQRIAMPPPRRYASGHGADVAVSRVAIAHQAAAARMRDFGPPDVSSASTRRAAHSAETAAMAKAAAAARASRRRCGRAAPPQTPTMLSLRGPGPGQQAAVTGKTAAAAAAATRSRRARRRA